MLLTCHLAVSAEIRRTLAQFPIRQAAGKQGHALALAGCELLEDTVPATLPWNRRSTRLEASVSLRSAVG